jgi:type IV pilus assembly protein PilB
MSRQLAAILEKAGVLQPQEIASALAKAEQTKRPLGEVILADGKISEETLAEVLSQQLRLPSVKLAATTIDSEAIRTVTEQLARKYICLPLTKEEDKEDVTTRRVKRRPTLVMAMADPTNLAAIQLLRTLHTRPCPFQSLLHRRGPLQGKSFHIRKPRQ